ncbi:MAG: non-ribosomal peptide synthase/polyketide synthase [Acidobacteriota bacterium]
MSRYRATTSGGPNFAYDLCARRTTPEQREGLDLSSWSVAFNGAETVRAETLERFAAELAPHGFRREAFYPCYGLAEATLFAAGPAPGEPAGFAEVEAAALEEHRVEPPRGDGAPSRVLTSCGRPFGQRIAVADPESGRELPPRQVGEIWISGPSVARGYWNRAPETERAFQARLAGSGEGPFLRTGDLGFLADGELFVTGRIKDLVILRGRNLYPQDIELTAERAHPALRPGCGAAFSVEVEGEERLVVVHEVERRPEADPEAVADALRAAVTDEHEVPVHEVVLLRSGTLPKTSSGKVQRHACRRGYLEGGLSAVYRSGAPRPEEEDGPEPEVRDLLALDPPARRPLLEAWLRHRVARAARIPAAKVGPDEPLAALGIDSLAAVELQHELHETLGASLPVADLLALSGVRELAGLLLPRLAAEPEGRFPAGLETAREFPLSRGQEALWFLDRLLPGNAAYHIPVAVRVLPPCDAEGLRRALAALVERHPALRTTIHSGGAGSDGADGPCQRVRGEIPGWLAEEDAGAWSEAELAARLEEEAGRPFDLEAGPPFRVLMLRRREGLVLLLVVHHLVADFWSLALLARELGELASGAPPEALRPPAAGYGDFVRWQRGRLDGEEGERLWGYWRKRLEGAPPASTLPLDRLRPQRQGHRGAARRAALPPDLAGRLHALARGADATLFTVLLAGFGALLARASGQEDLVIGSPTAGRDAPELAGVVGYFANPVALRLEPAGDLSFEALLRQARTTALEAFAHQELPFPLLAERLQPERDPGRSPVFQVLYVLQRSPLGAPPALAAFNLGEPGVRAELGGLALEALPLEERTSQFDLTLRVADTGDGLPVSVQYDTDLFDAVSIDRLLGHFRVLLEAAVERPGTAVSGLPWLTPAEIHQVLVEWNATAVVYPPADRALHELVEEQARRTPDAVAVLCEERSLTYWELSRRSGLLARFLRKLGVGPEVQVGICVERSPELVVGLLGILKAGGAYLPLDPDYPRERQVYMRQDSGAPVVLVHGPTAGLLDDPGCALVALDGPWERTAEGLPEVSAGTEPDNLAYVIYTSGSTGRPKAAMNSHRAIVNRLLWMQEAYGLEPSDRVLQKTPASFDVSVWEFFWPLLAGARLVLARPGGHRDPEYLARLIADEGVTTLHFVPSMLRAFLEAEGAGRCGAGLRRVFCSGEALSGDLEARCLALLGCPLHNLYGPTEAAVDVTFWACRGDSGERGVPIGRPIANTSIHLLDPGGAPVPVGTPGHLHIGGVGLARGYLGRPELTAERFVPDPWTAGGRLYATGDLARWRPDGAIDFLGRIDHQVKVRGVRVEPGEIEAALRQHPGVAEAVVVVREVRGEAWLVGYVVGDALPDAEELRRHLRERLPEAMVPSILMALPELPLTPSGKVDRKALPEPRPDPAAGTEARLRPLEELLAGIFSDLLGVEGIGAEADFFRLGGHSLLAVQAVSRIRRLLGVEVPVRSLFESPTLAGLASVVERLRAGDPATGAPPLRPLRPVPRGGLLPLSFAQERLWFLDRLEPGSPAYNMPLALRLRGGLDPAALEGALDAVAARHEALRTAFPAVEGRPVQAIAEPASAPLFRIDLSVLPDPEGAARELAAAEARQPFDLAEGPLFRRLLLRLGADDHVLLLTLHHAVADGWSTGVLGSELGAFYSALAGGEPAALPILPVQYADFAVWQREWLAGEALERRLAFWRDHLRGAPPLLELPLDRYRPAVRRSLGAQVAVPVPADLERGVAALGRSRGATRFMVLLAAFQAFLGRIAGQEDLVVGSPVANRGRLEVERLIGLFANTLALRGRVPGRTGFHELLAQARETVLSAHAFQELPFERLVEELQPERSLSYTPVYQVLLALQNAPGMPELPGIAVEPFAGERIDAKVDLTLTFTETPHGLAGSLVYDRALLDSATAARWAGSFLTLLAGAAADPEQLLSGLPLLSAAERGQLLREWNDPADPPGPPPEPVHRQFESWAARTPGARAVVFEDESLTYAELNGRVDRLAASLRGRGVGPESRVGLLAERSVEMVAGLLAILKAGGAYVPLDPEWPRDRVALLVEDAGLGTVLAPSRQAPGLAGLGSRILLLDDPGPAAPDGLAAEETLPGSLAYVLYTSGTTGRPKGVAVEHRQLAAYVRGVRERLALGEGLSFATVSTLAADLGNTAIFPALTSGGCLHVISRERATDAEAFAGYFERHGIDCLKIVPSHLAALQEAARPGRGLPRRRLVLGGEASTWEEAEALLARAPGCAIFNHYGPTEATVGVLTYAVRGDAPRRSATLPLGRPLPGSRVHVLDPSLELLPAGVPGEIGLAGAGLARGYLGKPDLTAERFVPNPHGTQPGERLYRTGDLARFLPDGNVEFLGRLDHQVKIRGFRIEPEEVEAALAQHPDVRGAVVLPVGDAAGGRRLAAFLVLEGGREAPAAELRAWLGRRLPDPMIPAVFVAVDAFPLTPNGKVDRRALASLAPAGAPEEEAEDAAERPRTLTEEVVAGIWCELLGRERVGIHDDFFAAGGHSLLATRLAARLQQVFHLDLPLREVFQAPSVAGLAALLEEARGEAPGPEPPPLTAAEEPGEAPLSFAQERLWFLDRLEPGGAVYNLPYFARLAGPLSIPVLRGAVAEILRRHAVLRTSFPAVDGRPVQRVAPPAEPAWTLADLGGLPRGRREEEAVRLAAVEARRPFDLARDLLLRPTLVRLGAEEHLLLLCLHHIASDAWSRGVLGRELSALYGAFAAGRPSPLPEPAIQYADFACWQRAWLRGEALTARTAYWRERLAGEPPPLELPYDRPRPAVRGPLGHSLGFALPATLGAGLERLARRHGATLFMALLAGFEALLARLSGQEDLVVGTPVANRRRPEVEGLIGCFVNTLALRGDLRGDPAVGELVARTRDAALAAYDHQDVPFEKLVEELQPHRDLAHAPLFQVMLVLQNVPLPAPELPGLAVDPVLVDQGVARFDLTLLLTETPRGLEGFWEHSAELFDRTTVARLGGWLAVLLEAAAADPGARLSELPLLGETERHQLRAEWGEGPALPADPAACLHELFEARAARTPEAVALVDGGETWTYAELDRRAASIARRLRARGVGAEVAVGICSERSALLVIGLLGILKSGGFYVPLDPAYPRERLAFMLDDSGARLLLASRGAAGRARELAGGGVEVLWLDAADSVEERDRERPQAGAQNLAYLIYTSGSTGRPKGVAIQHASAAALVAWVRETFAPEELEGVLFATSVSFDLSVFELFATLACGGRVILAENVLVLPRLPAAEGVTLVNTVPSALAELLRQGGLPASVRTVCLAGEPLPRALADQVLEAAPVKRLFNLYGPSEDTTYSTFARVEKGSRRNPPIGRPVAGTRALLLRDGIDPVPAGAAGEICLGGAGLARGYFGRPALSAERFTPDPLGREPGGRVYRTGDLGRYRADGSLEFLGRMDHQIKIRGFRVEPGEVAAVLAEHPGVADPVVVGREHPSGGPVLVAYFVAGAGSAPAAAELRRHLARRLPEHMIPAAFVCLDALPLTPGGKIDLRALPAPETPAAGGGAAPRTLAEELLAEIWSGLLGVRGFGVHESFFELGGHSLLAAQMVSRVREAFGLEIPLRSIFEAPTVAALAAVLDGRRAGGEGEIPPLAPVPRTQPLPLSFAQERLWFLERLAPGRTDYHIPAGLRLRGELRVAALEAALDGIVARHEALRTVFVAEDGRPLQVVPPPPGLALPVVDLGALPEGRREAAAAALARQEAGRAFDLERGPLLRALLLRHAPERHDLVLTLHHIAADGWSLGVLGRDLEALYRAGLEGLPSPLPPLPVQYGDFAVWQRAWLSGGELAGRLAAWKERLADAPATLALPLDRPRPTVQGSRGARVHRPLGPELSRGLAAFARARGATLFMAALAAFQALLARLTGEEDLVIGTTVANRSRTETEGLIGFFANTLPLRGRLAAAPCFDRLLEQVRETALAAYAQQDFPFGKLVEELRPDRTLAYEPLFQVMFVLQNVPAVVPELPGLATETLEVETGSAKLDLAVALMDVSRDLVGVWEHDADLFDRSTVARMAGHFANLAAAALESPGAPLAELPFLSAPERHQLLVEWNDSGAPPRDAPVQELFAEQARLAPGALAVAWPGGSWTYGELERRSDLLARALRELGVGPESVVGIRLGRSAEAVVAALGVLRAGGAYLTLDPGIPEERLSWIAAEAGLGLVLSPESRLPRPSGSPEGPQPLPPSGGDLLAYVIYTSGSTGRPKGVQIPHAGLLNLVGWHHRAYRIGPEDRASLVAAPAFDASVWELWPYLAAGASVHVVPDEIRLAPERLLRWLADEGITVCFLPTPMAEALLDAAERELPEGLALRALLTGGDTLRRPLRRGLPFTVLNHYGPTESSVVASWGPVEVDPRLRARPDIGRPVDNTRLYVADRALEPVPIGATGELCIGGAGLARGYLGQPAMTAERFAPDPFGADPGGRLYRTGDLVRLLPDGRLAFLGRSDHQVKIRGLRIEPGEIEVALGRHLGVREAVVVLDRAARLVAYVVPAGEAAPTSRELCELLAASLPDYMVPAVFSMLPALPLTPHGKVDRGSLPAVLEDEEGKAAAPRTPVEELLAEIWAGLLEVDRVGVGESFFELGGHSLLALRLVSRVRQVLGVDISLQTLFENPTVARLAVRVEALLAGDRRGGEEPPLQPVPRTDDLPLSFAQERLWFLDRLAPDRALYTIPFGLRLCGRPDVRALREALTEVVRRHEVLRTVFVPAGSRPAQRIRPPETLAAPLAMPQVDLSALPRAWEAALDLAEREVHRPFRLDEGPLLRSALWTAAPDEHLLLVVLHHIVFDGGSAGIFARELGALYEAFAAGRPSPLPPLAVQYADFAVWQRARLADGVLERQLAYWRERLDGAPPSLDLPTDRPRPPVQGGRGGLEPWALPAELLARLQAEARRQGATLFMTVLAGLAALLQRYTGREDLVVGTPVANRDRRELEDLVGFFVNTLPLRVAPMAADTTFAESLACVRATALGAYAHRDVPFERLVEETRAARDLSLSPLFQVLLLIDESGPPDLRLPGLRAEPLAFHSGTAKFDLTVSLAVDRGSAAGGIEYDRDLFEATTVRRLADHLARLLSGAVEDLSRRIGDLPLLSPFERQQALVEWNATEAARPLGSGLHELFERQVARTPEAVALIGGSVRLSYRSLDRRANRLARRLRALGVGPEVLVGVCSERTPDLVVALLAVLKAGGAYVPLDPAYPAERLGFLLADSAAPVVLAQERLAATLPPHSAEVVLLDDGGEDDAGPGGFCGPEQVAYLIYTSGSTGNPKGVAIQHASAVAMVSWALATFPPERLARVLASTSMCFDLSVFELFVPLAGGGAVVLADDLLALPELPAGPEVTLLSTVPSAMAELLRANAVPASVRTVNLAGEPLRRELVSRLYELPWIEEVYNLYGPSEDTTYSTGTLVERGAEQPPSIGRPLANTRAYVLDARLEPVPTGVPGELWLGGDGLARGYLGRPDLTAERFLPDAFGSGRLYRTGDLVRRLPSGEIEFLGRRDHQVKIRGFRIELEEIEAALLRQPGVREAVVVVRDGDPGGRSLAAYLAAAGVPPSVRELREALRRRLPEYMLPAAFVVLPELPRTPNGKVDRRALPDPEPAEEAGSAAPMNVVEELVAGIWCEVLGRASVGVRDDFFELGGHSLLAAQVFTRLRETLGVSLPVRALFEGPTVADLARRVEAERAEGAVPPAPIEPGRPRPAPLSLAQRRLWLLDQLSPGNAAYNLPAAIRLEGPLDVRCLALAVNGVIARHEVLRTAFVMVRGEPVQVVALPPAPEPVPIVDLEDLPAGRREEELHRVVAAQAGLPLRLDRGALLRVLLVRLGREEHAAVLVMHHIIADGWSLGIFIRELNELYAGHVTGGPVSLPRLPVQYADFAHWQTGLLRDSFLEEQLAAWKRALAGVPPLLELPADRPRPPIQSSRGALLSRLVPLAVREGLTALGRRQGASLFMTVLAAFNVLLRTWTGRDDVVVGTDFANRSRREIEPLLGFFMNQLPLRCVLAGSAGFLETLAGVRQVVLDAYTRQDLPFDILFDALRQKRSLSHAPLFQVKLILNNTPVAKRELAGLSVSPIEIDGGTAKMDLVVALAEVPEGLTLSFNYSTDLFEEPTISRMAEELIAILTAVVEQPGIRLDELDERIQQTRRRRRAMETSKRRTSSFGRFKEARPRGLDASDGRLVEESYLEPEQALPLVLTPAVPDLDLAEWAADNRQYVDDQLLKHGAILFRGFKVDNEQVFEQFAGQVCKELFNENGEHPRESLSGNVYTPVFYPPDQKLLWHNENSFNLRWPGKILFCCARPADQGGETPIVDSRRVFERLRPEVRDRFLQHGILYMRNYMNDVGLDWRTVFQTSDKAEAEQYCRENRMALDWKDGDRVRTRAHRPAAAKHPRTGEMSWFNQAQHFHVSCLDPETRTYVQSLFAEDDLPRNCYYGDGSPIEDSVMREILDVYRELEVVFPWQRGDILMLDNMLVAHARNAFVGPRKILVAMGDMGSYEDVG